MLSVRPLAEGAEWGRKELRVNLRHRLDEKAGPGVGVGGRKKKSMRKGRYDREAWERGPETYNSSFPQSTQGTVDWMPQGSEEGSLEHQGRCPCCSLFQHHVRVSGQSPKTPPCPTPWGPHYRRHIFFILSPHSSHHSADVYYMPTLW